MRRTSTTALWAFNVLVALALGSLFYLYASRPALRVAYVDSTRLFDDYAAMVDARRTYAGQQQEWQRNIDTLRQESSRALSNYQKQRAQLSPAQRQQVENELRGKRQQMLEYQRVVQEQDADMQRQITQPIVDSTNAFVHRYGKAQHYDLVLLTAEGDNIAYARDGLDITVPVLKELNMKYQKQASVKDRRQR